MNAPTVLITGAAGFIGSHVVTALVASGYQVIGVDNFDPYYARSWKEAALRRHGADPAFTFQELDVRDTTALAAALEGVRAVLHLAARPGVRQSVGREALYREVNENGTRAVLEACAAAGVRRLVFASSSSVYGAAVTPPFREDAPVGPPTSPYAATKRTGEAMVREFVRGGGGRAAIVRLFSVYGPRMRPDLALHVFTRTMARGGVVPVLGDGAARRDYTHVADAARGLLAALDWTSGPQPACETFNIGAGRPVRLDWLVSEVARCLGVEPRLDRHPPHPADLPVTWADTTRARTVLGFEPRVSLSEGIPDFVAWFEREHGRHPSAVA